jgi:hypothetical protein
MRDYSKLPYSNNFDNFFNPSKSLTNKNKKQKIKKTIKTITRLYSLYYDNE